LAFFSYEIEVEMGRHQILLDYGDMYDSNIFLVATESVIYQACVLPSLIDTPQHKIVAAECVI
jgi:hypothetical protein